MAGREVELVDCDSHGQRPITFVCTHIAHALVEGNPSSFLIAPEGPDPYPLAWCDACDEMVVELGGRWTPEASDCAEFKLLCASCYVEARELARIAGLFRDLTEPGAPAKGGDVSSRPNGDGEEW